MTTGSEKREDTTFRDQLATIDKSGKRLWVYAKKPKGKLTAWRNIVGFVLIIFFFAAPFLRINGQPLLLLNFIERKFVVVGVQFWPQDFHLFFLAMISIFVFVILFTVVYGRLWCGWACPQTVFMELIFRRIEYWIEGDAPAQKRLAKQGWNFGKIWKKSLKHLIFYIFSFIVGNTFLAYIIGTEQLFDIITDDPREHLAGLAGMIVFSGVFYFIFSWFREQVCSIVCPYGRLQGVLLDRSSVVVAYDYRRGEPRAALKKDEDRTEAGKGDCVECGLCVAVCPTGIDIRNGTQLECINCACCIDACNATMKRNKLPQGLVRYASEKMIAEKVPWKFTARSMAYTAVLVVLLGVIVYSLVARSSIEATILRAPGMLYQEQDNNRISNVYVVKMVNKTNEDLPVDIRLLSVNGEVKVIGDEILVKGQTVGESVFFVYLDKDLVTDSQFPVTFGVYSGEQLIEEISSTFMGPN